MGVMMFIFILLLLLYVIVTIVTNHYYYSKDFYHDILTITFREFQGYDPIFNQSHIKQPRFCGSLEKHTNH